MLKKIYFTTEIEAPREKVWKTLWDDTTYRAWTSVFSEGSRAISDWKEGSKILFVDGSHSGMYSRIAEMKPNTFMSFEHLGIMKDGVELPLDEQTKAWSGSREEYNLTSKGKITVLEVSLDSDNDYVDYFSKTFPKALQKVKELSES